MGHIVSDKPLVRYWDKDFREIPQHVTARINDGWYVCETCAATGSERWAYLHQFPFVNTATFEPLTDWRK